MPELTWDLCPNLARIKFGSRYACDIHALEVKHRIFEDLDLEEAIRESRELREYDELQTRLDENRLALVQGRTLRKRAEMEEFLKWQRAN